MFCNVVVVVLVLALVGQLDAVCYDRECVLIIVWNVLIIYFALSKLYSSFVL